MKKRRHLPLPGHPIGNIPFAVRYIKLVVECFESYHSHFDELARRIDRREDFTFHFDNAVESITGNEQNERGTGKREKDQIRSPRRFLLILYMRKYGSKIHDTNFARLSRPLCLHACEIYAVNF